MLRQIAKTAIGAAIGQKTMGRGLIATGVGIAATRLATRSIPGALLVGGAYLAKKIYDQRKASKDIPASEMIIDQKAIEKSAKKR